MGHKTATLNVPCTGVFKITVAEDGWWEVCLEHKDGTAYFRTRGSMFDVRHMMDHTTMDFINVPDWMWLAIYAKIDELNIMFQRNSLDAPVSNGVTV